MLGNIQISRELFNDLLLYFFPVEDSGEMELDYLYRKIQNSLQYKVEAMQRRETYTRYKTASTKEQQEAARQEYLNQARINKNFRW